MTRGLAVSAVVALLVGVVGCSERAAPVQETAELNQARASQNLKGVLDRFTTAILKEFPELATSLAVSEDVAGGKYSDRLVDLSPESVARRAQLVRNTRQELAQIDRAQLSAADACDIRRLGRASGLRDRCTEIWTWRLPSLGGTDTVRRDADPRGVRRHP